MTDKSKECEPKDIVLLSNPSQYQCKHCGQTWYENKETPICKKPAPKPKANEGWEDNLQNKVAELLDSYFPDHKDCECSRCLAFIHELKDFLHQERTKANEGWECCKVCQCENGKKMWCACHRKQLKELLHLERTKAVEERDKEIIALLKKGKYTRASDMAMILEMINHETK